MRQFIFCVLLSIMVSGLTAQSTYYIVEGKVFDKESKLPLQGASVFAQNTTIGSVSASDGSFTLYLPNGGYDLIITYTGYTTESRRVSSSNPDLKNMSVEIEKKDISMQDVAVRSSNEVKDGLEKYGSFLMENFIGKTANSKACTISNKEALKFYFSKKRNRLKVMASEPLEIINEALGYRIKYALDSFIYDYNTQVTLYTGYPLFEAITSTDSLQAVQWVSNRKQAYQGSLLHFMRSMYAKQLRENGFEIQFLVKENEEEKAIIPANTYGAVNYTLDDSTKIVSVLPNQLGLVVIYSKSPPEENYIKENPEEIDKFQLTICNFSPNQPIYIEENGYYFDQIDIIISQYLGWKKMADMLPYDYKPD